MRIIKNNFWGITAIYSVGFLSLRAISFLLLPLYTNLLSTLEAGYVFILYTIIAFLNMENTYNYIARAIFNHDYLKTMFFDLQNNRT